MLVGFRFRPTMFQSSARTEKPILTLALAATSRHRRSKASSGWTTTMILTRMSLLSVLALLGWSVIQPGLFTDPPFSSAHLVVEFVTRHYRQTRPGSEEVRSQAVLERIRNTVHGAAKGE